MTNDQKQGIIMHVRKTLLSEKFAKEAISMKERERVLELVKNKSKKLLKKLIHKILEQQIKKIKSQI